MLIDNTTILIIKIMPLALSNAGFTGLVKF